MQRNFTAAQCQTFDVIIVGGGIYGAALLWEATTRGLRAALFEKDDFGGATSANSLKIIHGGLRYLQHADIKRLRESMAERLTLMRIAPHLIHPLPVLMPTYGHGIKGPEAMRLAMIANDMLTLDRNRLSDPQKYIPNGRVVSRAEVLKALPGINEAGLNGGAIFYDARACNSERLTLAYIRSAVGRGAVAANYAKVIDLLREGDAITGVTVCDQLTNERHDVRARMVINAAGPWAKRVLQDTVDTSISPLAAGMNIIVNKELFEHYAVGMASKQVYHDSDALVSSGNRLLFVVPWRGQSMIGTDYWVYDGHPRDFTVENARVQRFLDEFNEAYPAARLTLEDVSFVHGGLLPMSGVDAKSGQPILNKHYHFDDHRAAGVNGLLTVSGVKYTTARDVAAKAIDWVYRNAWQQAAPRSHTRTERLYGGRFERYDALVQQIEEQVGDAATAQRLASNYGSCYADVLAMRPTHGDVWEAETLYAIRNEMAQTLDDVVFRRTELGSAGIPDTDILLRCAQRMAAELGWSEREMARQLDEVCAKFPQPRPTMERMIG